MRIKVGRHLPQPSPELRGIHNTRKLHPKLPPTLITTYNTQRTYTLGRHWGAAGLIEILSAGPGLSWTFDGKKQCSP